MNIPDCVNKVACFIFLLSLLWLLPWAASHDVLQEGSASKKMSTEVEPERRGAEKITTAASEEELPPQGDAEAKQDAPISPEKSMEGGEEKSMEIEEQPQRTQLMENNPTLVDKTEEWDWSVCPSAFGSPCPMMP